jgi:hypothetical protein
MLPGNSRKVATKPSPQTSAPIMKCATQPTAGADFIIVLSIARKRCGGELHIRHHSLFTPRDFDVSPYFEIIKPTIERGFDFRQLDWSHNADDGPIRPA